ncbi:hypothetical protein ABE10_01305, partial [Bacillus toyonensis]|nr:hypothetical protein [Bacillus toyonensis]
SSGEHVPDHSRPQSALFGEGHAAQVDARVDRVLREPGDPWREGGDRGAVVEPIGRVVLGDDARGLGEQIGGLLLVELGERLRVQLLHLRVVVAEVVGGVGEVAEVAGLDVQDEAQVVVPVLVDVLEPGGELDGLDLQGHPDLLEVRDQDLRHGRPVERRDRQREGQLLLARFLEELPGLVRVVGDAVREVLVAGVELGDRSVERLARADGLDECLVVDRQAQRLTHALVVQRGLGVVEGERRLVRGAPGGEGEPSALLQLRGEVGVDSGEHVEAPVERGVDTGGEVGDVVEDDLGEACLLAPIGVIAGEGDRAALLPGLQGEGACAVLGVLQLGGVALRVHQPGDAGEREEEVLAGCGEGHHDRLRVRRGDRGDSGEVGVALERRVVLDRLERGDDVA